MSDPMTSTDMYVVKIKTKNNVFPVYRLPEILFHISLTHLFFQTYINERQAKIDKDVASEESTKREKCNDFEINLENCEFLSSA